MPSIKLLGTPLETKWSIWSVMLFPDNDVLRQQRFNIEQVKHRIIDENDDALIEIDAHALQLLIDTPDDATMKDKARERMKEGVVVGDLFAIIYLMDRFQLSEPSMNKAIFITSEFAKNNKYGVTYYEIISQPP